MAKSTAGKSPSDQGGCTKLIFGIVAGMILSGVYINYNWALPGWMQIPGLVQGLGARTVADSVIEDPKADLATKQRAVEELFRRDPNLFRELDDDMGNVITRAVIDRKARRRLMIFQSAQNAMREQLGKHEAIRKAAERQYETESLDEIILLTGIKNLREDAFLYGYLLDRFPESSDRELIEEAMALRPQEVFEIVP